MKTEALAGALVATILNGQALSDVVDVEGARSLAFLMPAAWDAANLTFQGCDTPTGTFVNVYDDAGTEVSVTAAAARGIPVGTVTKNLAAFRYLKIRSGTSGAAVNQTADRQIQVIMKG